LKAGIVRETIDALREGRRPATMSADEALVYDFVTELTLNKGECDSSYQECINCLGEQGVVDLVGLVGYFTLISMVLNVANTPADAVEDVAPLPALPR